MANAVFEVEGTEQNDEVKRQLKAELDGIAARLRREAEVPSTGMDGGNFLDVAQRLERQDQEELITSRLMEQAKRLRVALARLNRGEYGVCSDCAVSIPRKRLLAVPDATTCVACQDRLEHSDSVRPSASDGVDGEDV